MNTPFRPNGIYAIVLTQLVRMIDTVQPELREHPIIKLFANREIPGAVILDSRRGFDADGHPLPPQLFEIKGDQARDQGSGDDAWFPLAAVMGDLNKFGLQGIYPGSFTAAGITYERVQITLVCVQSFVPVMQADGSFSPK